MTVRHQLVVSVVAAAGLIASAVAPVPSLATSAQAQQTDGKRLGEANRADRPGKAAPPARPNPPTVNRSPTQERSGQSRNARRDRDNTPNRAVVRDGDRRRDDGDGRRRGTRYVWGPGIAFYFFDGFYHGDCSWLRSRARETGSSYWRQRYEQCRDE